MKPEWIVHLATYREHNEQTANVECSHLWNASTLYPIDSWMIWDRFVHRFYKPQAENLWNFPKHSFLYNSLHIHQLILNSIVHRFLEYSRSYSSPLVRITHLWRSSFYIERKEEKLPVDVHILVESVWRSVYAFVILLCKLQSSFPFFLFAFYFRWIN